jgi:hypothetical protein
MRKIKIVLRNKNKNKNKHMQNKSWVSLQSFDNSSCSDASKSDFNLVYYYLLAGITLVMAAFLFLPRIAVG